MGQNTMYPGVTGYSLFGECSSQRNACGYWNRLWGAPQIELEMCTGIKACKQGQAAFLDESRVLDE